MKRAILYLILPALLFYSCKKEHSTGTNPAQKTYKVSLTLSGFSASVLGSTPGKQTLSGVKTDADVPIASYIKRLSYAVYDASGNLVHTISKDSTYVDLGSVTDSLASGTYTVLVGGGQANFASNFATSTLATATVTSGWQDTFFATATLTVSGSNVSQTISLSRIVGKLTLKVLDTIPPNANSISMALSTDYAYYSAASLGPITAMNNVAETFGVAASAKGQPNFTRSIDVLNTIQPFTVTITCYDASNNIIAQRVVQNVSVAVDTQTVLSGDLFNSGSGINPGLNLGTGTPIVAQF
jgi:hypothetical protein